MKKYNLSTICKRANELVKAGYDKSAAFKTAWSEAKAQPKDITAKVHEFRELQKMIEELQAKADELKQEIISDMNGQEELKLDSYTVRYITVTRKILDTSKFKQDNKDLYELYLKANQSKRFTITA